MDLNRRSFLRLFSAEPAGQQPEGRKEVLREREVAIEDGDRRLPVNELNVGGLSDFMALANRLSEEGPNLPDGGIINVITALDLHGADLDKLRDLALQGIIGLDQSSINRVVRPLGLRAQTVKGLLTLKESIRYVRLPDRAEIRRADYGSAGEGAAVGGGIFLGVALNIMASKRGRATESKLAGLELSSAEKSKLGEAIKSAQLAIAGLNVEIANREQQTESEKAKERTALKAVGAINQQPVDSLIKQEQSLINLYLQRLYEPIMAILKQAGGESLESPSVGELLSGAKVQITSLGALKLDLENLRKFLDALGEVLPGDNQLARRKFLKMSGLGAASVAFIGLHGFSSSARAQGSRVATASEGRVGRDKFELVPASEAREFEASQQEHIIVMYDCSISGRDITRQANYITDRDVAQIANLLDSRRNQHKRAVESGGEEKIPEPLVSVVLLGGESQDDRQAHILVDRLPTSQVSSFSAIVPREEDRNGKYTPLLAGLAETDKLARPNERTTVIFASDMVSDPDNKPGSEGRDNQQIVEAARRLVEKKGALLVPLIFPEHAKSLSGLLAPPEMRPAPGETYLGGAAGISGLTEALEGFRENQFFVRRVVRREEPAVLRKEARWVAAATAAAVFASGLGRLVLQSRKYSQAKELSESLTKLAEVEALAQDRQGALDLAAKTAQEAEARLAHLQDRIERFNKQIQEIDTLADAQKLLSEFEQDFGQLMKQIAQFFGSQQQKVLDTISPLVAEVLANYYKGVEIEGSDYIPAAKLVKRFRTGGVKPEEFKIAVLQVSSEIQSLNKSLLWASELKKLEKEAKAKYPAMREVQSGLMPISELADFCRGRAMAAVPLRSLNGQIYLFSTRTGEAIRLAEAATLVGTDSKTGTIIFECTLDQIDRPVGSSYSSDRADSAEKVYVVVSSDREGALVMGQAQIWLYTQSQNIELDSRSPGTARVWVKEQISAGEFQQTEINIPGQVKLTDKKDRILLETHPKLNADSGVRCINFLSEGELVFISQSGVEKQELCYINIQDLKQQAAGALSKSGQKMSVYKDGQEFQLSDIVTLNKIPGQEVLAAIDSKGNIYYLYVNPARQATVIHAKQRAQLKESDASFVIHIAPNGLAAHLVETFDGPKKHTYTKVF